ncbi:MAG: ATP-dependent helicase HrpB, partial [Acidimicrobiales bacterium]
MTGGRPPADPADGPIQANPPFPADLPINAVIPDLCEALRSAGTAVLRAPPGAGKTTEVPLRLLDQPWLSPRRIMLLEPRRLAARAAARRMASRLGEAVGDTVGVVTRDERRVGRSTRIEVVTEGILTRRLQRSPDLDGVGLVILDEFHERNLQSDLGLAFLLDVRGALRADLRLLVMSATLDVDRVALAVGDGGTPAPVVASDGRSHPVELRYRPPPPRVRPVDAVAQAVTASLATDPGDVLVFLAGAGDIRRVERALRPAVGADVDVRPLFGALSAADQDAALAASPPGRRRVVLSTDIAETSLTVDGVRVVVDTGDVRVPRYDPRTGMTRLRTTDASRASADQRTGRAGRTERGIAYRLETAGDHARRAPHALPEIMTTDLAGLALELALWGSDERDLTYLDPPPAGALAAARELLVELGAIDGAGRITPTGRSIAELPVHPRLGRMVIEGEAMGHGELACVVAALLDERDILPGRPGERSVDIVDRVRIVLDRTGRDDTGGVSAD